MFEAHVRDAEVPGSELTWSIAALLVSRCFISAERIVTASQRGLVAYFWTVSLNTILPSNPRNAFEPIFFESFIDT